MYLKTHVEKVWEASSVKKALKTEVKFGNLLCEEDLLEMLFFALKERNLKVLVTIEYALT
jgi:hypothetical protein